MNLIASKYRFLPCRKICSNQNSYHRYTFEHAECTTDAHSLPTIKVHVSPARKKSVKAEMKSVEILKDSKMKTRDDTAKHMKEDKSFDRIADTKNQSKRISEKPIQTSLKKIDTLHSVSTEQENSRKKKKRKYNLSDDLKNVPEEYIPDAPKTKKSSIDFKYIPSQKSALESMPLVMNEYTPTLCDNKCIPEDVNYVPNSIEKLEVDYETYEPCATTAIPNDILKEYVPNSKGIKSSIEEYEPDFKSPSKLMKFDDSYVPSVRQNVPNEFRRILDKSEKSKIQKIDTHRKGTLSKRKMDLFS